MLGDLFKNGIVYKIEGPSSWILVCRMNSFRNYPDDIEKYHPSDKVDENPIFYVLSYSGDTGAWNTNYSKNFEVHFQGDSVLNLIFTFIRRETEKILSMRVLKSYDSYNPTQIQFVEISEVDYKELPLYLENTQNKFEELLCSL